MAAALTGGGNLMEFREKIDCVSPQAEQDINSNPKLTELQIMLHSFC